MFLQALGRFRKLQDKNDGLKYLYLHYNSNLKYYFEDKSIMDNNDFIKFLNKLQEHEK